MKFIIFAVISLCITLASAGRARRGLSPDEITQIKKLYFPQDPKCGVFNNQIDFNNPDQLDALNLPWIVSLTRKNDSQHICDGVLIYPDVLMTSASCIEKHMSVALIATARNMELVPRSLYSDNYQREVSAIHIDPFYKACSRHRSNALVILSDPFVLDEHIKVACLPNLTQAYNTRQCVMNLIEDKLRTSGTWDKDNECESQVFVAPSLSKSMSDASCQQGNDTDAFIRESHSYILSCEAQQAPGKFYWVGSSVFVSMCGPELWKYQFYDTVYKSLSWMHSILRRRFSYYDSNEPPIWD